MCAVQVGFLRETYIFGSAIFIVNFLETFSEIKIAIGVRIRYLQMLYHHRLCIYYIIYHYIVLYEVKYIDDRVGILVM